MAVIRVWDWPIRLFHWSLVLLVLLSYLSAQIGGEWMLWHGRFGLAILGLLVFRFVWGFIGTHYALFVNFFPTPSRLRSHFHGHWHSAGHNPLGGLSVFALLGLMLIQVITGLFANDDIAFEGPLYSNVTKALSDQLTSIHHGLFNVLIAFIALHVFAIFAYLLIKKNNLIRPMLTGVKQIDEVHAVPNHRVVRPMLTNLMAFMFAVLIALFAVWLVQSDHQVASPAVSSGKATPTPAVQNW